MILSMDISIIRILFNSKFKYMKRSIVSLILLLVAITVSAQFEKGTKYIGSSLSGASLSYNGSEKGSFGIQAKAGYFLQDDWMVTAQLSYDKKNDVPASYSIGGGVRYYIVQNGLYLGAGVSIKHYTTDFNDFMPGIQIGYSFFLNKSVTVEPELFYDQSFKNHGDYSTFGVRVGLGVYL